MPSKRPTTSKRAATPQRVADSAKTPKRGYETTLADGVLDIDESAEVIPFTYAITSYGADYTVDGLMKRMREENVFIPLFSAPATVGDKGPKFQREFVWKKVQADRFIESLLIGLPVPGIFLVKEKDGRHLVLDGHQRLRTLQAFCTNLWENEPFALEAVQSRFKGKTYQTLDAADRRRLDDSILHATIVRQDEPGEDLSSIYLIFERLNSGGTNLQPQEIRVALYHGPFVQFLSSLNSHKSWRTLFGKKSRRLKDIELILRFLALLESSKNYARPMKSFLSSYMGRRRGLKPVLQSELRNIFVATTDAILQGIGPKAFKPKGAVNAALVDALMVGVARRIRDAGKIGNVGALKAQYQQLLKLPDFQQAISRATADEESVKSRLSLAVDAFKKV